jgi:guanylate cyclase
MESHGTPGRIQVTQATYELLKDDFECEARGPIMVKGKGEMDVWYVLGRQSSLASFDEPATGQPAEVAPGT